MSKIVAIASVTLNGVIGYDNQLVLHSKADMKRFSALTKTMDGIVIMGKKTFDSIGKPLKDRTNVVVTRTANITSLPAGIHVVHNLVEAVQNLKAQGKSAWICGGAAIYEACFAYELIDEVDLTIVNKNWSPPEQDPVEMQRNKTVFFPTIPYNFTVDNEEINKDDPSLLHRRYKKIAW